MKTKQQQAADRWEAVIREECRALREQRRAWVDKNWEAPRVPGTHIPREASKPDFSGWLPGGTHVVFEAKATLAETSFDFNMITEGQWEHLQAAHENDAVSFVYVLDGKGRRWVVPFGHILALDAAGVRSMRFDSPFQQFRQLGEWQRSGAVFRWSGEDFVDTLGRLRAEEEAA